jgi:uncharacterized lipoprotein YddW (UPF0748 family)
VRRRTGAFLLLGVLAAALLLCAVALDGCRAGGRLPAAPISKRTRPLPMPSPVKAVWVARFHYHFPDDIRTIMRNCARDGFNTVLWQVRGEGTVLYPSKIEPWSAEYGYRDPGFDPLQIAVEQAHRHGLRIEAWVNVMPGWKGPERPPVQNQLWHTRPDWFLHDAAGNRQPLGKFYVILNPCLPEVRRYIAGVVAEIVTNYDVDGVHLDYVRYAWETTPNARDLYPRDPTTLQIYRQQTGKHPADNPREWNHWRADRLTRLVGEIRDRINRHRPGATLTAAVWSTPQVGYRDYFQNALAWLHAGTVDAVMPMAYTAQVNDFERYIGAYHTAALTRRIIPGLGLYKHEIPEQIGQQLDRCRTWGGDFALFSYGSLHATAGDRGRDGKARIDAGKKRLQQMRTGVVRRFTAH